MESSRVATGSRTGTRPPTTQVKAVWRALHAYQYRRMEACPEGDRELLIMGRYTDLARFSPIGPLASPFLGQPSRDGRLLNGTKKTYLAMALGPECRGNGTHMRLYAQDGRFWL